MGADVRGSQDADGEPMDLSDTAGTDDQGKAETINVRGETWVPEDWGRAGVTEDKGRAEGKEKPAEAVGVERRSATEGL